MRSWRNQSVRKPCVFFWKETLQQEEWDSKWKGTEIVVWEGSGWATVGMKRRNGRFLNALLSTVCDWKQPEDSSDGRFGEKSVLSIEEAFHRLTGTEIVPKFSLTSFPLNIQGFKGHDTLYTGEHLTNSIDYFDTSRWRQRTPSKRWLLFAVRHNQTSQENSVFITAAFRVPNLAFFRFTSTQ